MDTVVSSFTDLLADAEVVCDSTGSLSAVARWLGDVEPSLLVLLDGDRRVIAADDLGGAFDAQAVAALAEELVLHIHGREECQFEMPTAEGQSLAFGVLLPPDMELGILGGLVPPSELAESRLAEVRTGLAVCGDLVRRVLRAESEAAQSQARVRQLQRAAAAESDPRGAAPTSEPCAAASAEAVMRLAQNQKLELIGQLAAGIAHEINTPTQYMGDNTQFLSDAFGELRALLTRCLGLQEAARSNQPTAQAVAEIVAAVEQSDVEFLLEEIPKAIAQSAEGVERVASIVRSIKEFSHPSGKEKQPVDLNQAIQSTLTMCRSEWKHTAQVVTDLDPRLPQVTCSPGEMNQVLLNLIVNAAHAVQAKLGENPAVQGSITVCTRCDGDWAEIRVEDTGTGIPEEIRGKVFDPFFTTKEIGRGTGQGLAISRAIVVEKHGGTITFDSVVDRGTVFIVRIPIRSEARPRERCDP